MLKFLLLNTSTASTPSDAGQQGDMTQMIIMLVLLAAMVYFMLIRPNKKRKKQEAEDRELKSNSQIGDEIVTIAGMHGRIISVTDETIVVESGPDRTRVKMEKWAIQTNISANERKNNK